jgi:hypothetical protein
VDIFSSKRHADARTSFPALVISQAMAALTAAAPDMIDIGRRDLWPDALTLCSAAYWARASWQLQVVASAPVPGARRANLYFHGWLHEAARARGQTAEILQPLVGVFHAHGSVQHDPGDGDLRGTGACATQPTPTPRITLTPVPTQSGFLPGALPP